MPSIETTPGYNEQRALATLERLVSVTSGVLLNRYAHNDVKRVVHVDSDDEVEASGEDALGEISDRG